MQSAEKRAYVVNRLFAQTGDVNAAHRYGKRLFFKPVAVARLARRGGHILFDFRLDIVAARLAVAAFEIVDDAFIAARKLAGKGAAFVLHVYLFAAVAVQKNVFYVVGQVAVGGVHRKAVSFGQRAEIHLAHVAHVHVPARNRKRAFV